ncbi:PrgI family protein [Candidatus Kaiserbacteria bacterium]|nr:PrgI family protein [Candidatus Kaiserbacteria bacterium]
MQFQVPQFIEVEDKIFGPLTFKQFIYMGGGLGTAYILWRVLPLYLALPLILTFIGLAVALAFFQYNGRPFIIGLESAFYYFLRGKLYLWNNARKHAKAEAVRTVSPHSAQVYVPKLSDSKLHDLAWSLDIQERIAAGTIEDTERAPRDRLSGLVTAREARI